eukprot:COSAG02_NODE_45369_length_357_cov_12.965116_1_plen_40_part_01
MRHTRPDDDTGHKALCPVSRHAPGILMLTEPGILGCRNFA